AELLLERLRLRLDSALLQQLASPVLHCVVADAVSDVQADVPHLSRRLLGILLHGWSFLSAAPQGDGANTHRDHRTVNPAGETSRALAVSSHQGSRPAPNDRLRIAKDDA